MIMAMPPWAETLGTEPSVRATAIVLGGIVVAYVAEIVMKRVLLQLAKHTTTTLDDEIIEILRRPVFLSVIFAALAWAASILEPGELASWIVVSALESFTIIVWSTATFRIGALVLDAIARRDTSSIVRPDSLPVFLIFWRLGVIVVSLYFVFLTWRIDLTAWIASAGILGIALGFAAKDTLANLFAGVFILADAPYKVGDTIRVDNELRGRVVRIGMRSTRLLTRDDVEITIPNSVIGNARVINEAGGPQIAQRVRVKVFAAYGSDVDRVRATLAPCADGVKNVCETPAPEVRFRELGESGLRFELLVWVDEAAQRGRVIDELTTRVYKAFQQAGIEIPYNKLDVYLRGQATEPLATTSRPASSRLHPPRLG
jgi:MscS family membrane protein